MVLSLCVYLFFCPSSTVISTYKVLILLYYTSPIAEILCVKNGRAIVVCGFLMKWLKKYILKVWKKLWEPFRSCLLNSTANPAHFHPSLAGLAVLFSRQLLNGSPTIFFKLSAYFFKINSLKPTNHPPIFDT